MIPKALALCALLLLAACGSTPTHYYILTAGEAVVSASNDATLSVEVNELRLPQYLDRPQIVTHSSDNQLELAEHDQWGGHLRDNMMRLLAKNLGTALGTTKIIISPYRPSEAATVRVMIEVIRFERMADKQVQLDAQWRLIDGTSNRSLSTKISHLRDDKKSADMAQTVSAMSRIYSRFSNEIAGEIQRVVHSNSH
ncbi:MAG: PqiC family protein [Mariprofundales bacterium]